VLFKHQWNYIKVVKTHFCVINHHNLVKKFIFMMKVDFLQLKKLYCQTYLFKNILNSYHSVVNYTLCFINIMLTFFKTILSFSNMTLLFCLCLWEVWIQMRMWRVRFWKKLRIRMKILSMNFRHINFTLIVFDFFFLWCSF